MLKRLINLLPVSRRRYLEAMDNLFLILDGLVEAEANHCQIEMNIIQSLQQGTGRKPKSKGSKQVPDDPAFM